MNGEDLIYLQHMLDSAMMAVDFVAGRSRNDLDSDAMLALALARLLEIMGEATRHVSGANRSEHEDIPWQQIAATRNRLIHGYFDVDLDIVWSIVTRDLPPLIPRLERLILQMR